MKTKFCEKCGSEVTVNNFTKHYHSCKGKKTYKAKEEWKLESGLYKCPECEVVKTKRGIGIHIWKSHTKEGQKHSKEVSYKKGRKPWNKGLTEETSESVKKGLESLREKYKTGKLHGSRKGKKHTEEFKKHLSLYRVKYLTEHPEKVPYRLNHSSKMSYPEKVFQNALRENKIEGWVYNFQNSLYSYDFAFPELKIDVEIDGGTHLLEKVKQIDKRRDEFSKSQGWRVIRFTAKEVKENVTKCINELKTIMDL